MYYFFIALWACAIIGSPVLLVLGWIRWVRRTQPRSVFAVVSFAGFVLATASALLVVNSLVYSHFIGGFPFYDLRLLRIYRWGFVLSLSAVVLAAGGVWRPGPLRWHAPLCAFGTLILWIFAASGE